MEKSCWGLWVVSDKNELFVVLCVQLSDFFAF